MPVEEPNRGHSTATPLNVSYRVGRITPYLSRRWLDYGCEGGYSAARLAGGAAEVVGVDVEEDRIDAAVRRGVPNTTFQAFDGSRLAFADASFDGAFVNEVLEHVADEQTSLREIRRVLRPGGYLVLISPNRWVLVEGHWVTIGKLGFGPAPLIPWLPERLTRSWTRARNYWPRQLVRQVRAAGFAVLETGFIWPMLEEYPWLPARAVPVYQRYVTRLDDVPGLRRFGLSALSWG